jgi:hypothetical protein
MPNSMKMHVIDHLSIVRHHRGMTGSVTRAGLDPKTISVMENPPDIACYASNPDLAPGYAEQSSEDWAG